MRRHTAISVALLGFILIAVLVWSPWAADAEAGGHEGAAASTDTSKRNDNRTAKTADIAGSTRVTCLLAGERLLESSGGTEDQACALY